VNLSLAPSLAPADNASLFGWSPAVFPVEGRDMEWAKLGWHVVGMGGVVVRPEFQKMGIPALMFEKLHAEAPGVVGAETFTLFCLERLVPYSRRHGYGRIDRALTLQQRGQPTGTTFSFMARGDAIASTGGGIEIPSIPW